MNAKPTPDLGLAIPERWTVRTIYRHQTKKEREAKMPPEEKHHELCYGGCCIEKETGERGLKRLREMSDLFNRMKVAPRDRAVQCLADESGSIENHLAKQNRRAASYTEHVVRKEPMAAKVDWFSRGRDAFTGGRPCFIRDARISSSDRAAWYAGWNHQSRTNGLANMSDQDRAELAAGFAEILTALRSTP